MLEHNSNDLSIISVQWSSPFVCSVGRKVHQELHIVYERNVLNLDEKSGKIYRYGLVKYTLIYCRKLYIEIETLMLI